METELLKADSSGLLRAAEIIKEGNTVVFPTETVYGLGADATSEDAVKKIFEAKGRPSDNPLIVHIADICDVDGLVTEVPEKAKLLMEKFWPGPLTIIMKKSSIVPNSVTAGLATVGVRMPENETAREFIRLAGTPVAAPSANISGKPSPTNFKDVFLDMNGRAAGIIEGEPSRVGVESTVIDMTAEIPTVLRPGGVTIEELEDVIGKVLGGREIKDVETPKAPGMKYRHYAPAGRVYILKGSIDEAASFIKDIESTGKKVGVMMFDEFKEYFKESGAEIVSLGSKEKPEDAANRLFSALREMDKCGAQVCFAPEIPEEGLWLAVRNRLYKAAADNILDLNNLKSVLFVCTGNTCRSPMAEAIFASIHKGVYVSSAGLMAQDGESASDNAVFAMKEQKIDLSSHRARQITPQMIEKASLVLTMTKSHKAALSHFSNVYTLSEFAGEDQDITDPYGGTKEDYICCSEELKSLIEKIKI